MNKELNNDYQYSKKQFKHLITNETIKKKNTIKIVIKSKCK